MTLNVRRLALVFLLSTVLPLIMGVLIDVNLGTAPYATITLGLISIPIASVVVSRATLAEFDLAIERIASWNENGLSEKVADRDAT